MKKLKNSPKAKIKDLSQKMFRAMEKGHHDEVIALGEELIAAYGEKNAPAELYYNIGEAYVNKITSDENFWQKPRQEQINIKKAAFKCWEKAFVAGLLKTPEEIIYYVIFGSETFMHLHLKMYRVIKDTFAKIRQGIYAKPSPGIMALYYENFVTCAVALGFHAEAFEAARESWLAAKDTQKRAERYGGLLLIAQYLDFSAADLFELHKVYDSFFKDIEPHKYDLAALTAELKQTGRRIRVGYISPDCRRHVAAKFFAGLLRFADREKFAVYMYSTTDKPDAVTDKIKDSVEFFVPVPRISHEELSARIMSDGIDILVELAGHTDGNALPVLAWKSAPVQICGIGYLATTGLSTVDYYITDSIVDPPGQHEQYFTEKPLFLSSQFSAYATLEGDIPDIADAPFLKNGFVTFGVFNQYRKITDEMIAAWGQILARSDNSRLLLKCSEYANEEFVTDAKARFAAFGLPAERLIFEKATRDYMARYLDVDIALDTYPYTGGGTTLDALYMGVPLVTLYGERRNTRFSLGILANVGLKYLAADSVAKYVELAVQLAADRNLLNALHRKIRPMLTNSVPGRPDLYTKELEQQYLQILGLGENP